MQADAAAQPARSPEEPLLEQLERLSALIAARDQELKRLRADLVLRDLYIDELHRVLRQQAERLERIEEKIRRIAAAGGV
ncbi:MAG: hypothetical protein ACUVS7_11860 [Bryobacteraceae bacterium]